MYIKLYIIKYERLLTPILGGYDFAEFYALQCKSFYDRDI